MNKTRRADLAAARETLEQAKQLIEDAKLTIETARDEEQEYFDAMPESLQGGDKGVAAEAAVDRLTDVANDLDTMGSDLDGLIESVGEAEA